MKCTQLVSPHSWLLIRYWGEGLEVSNPNSSCVGCVWWRKSNQPPCQGVADFFTLYEYLLHIFLLCIHPYHDLLKLIPRILLLHYMNIIPTLFWWSLQILLNDFKFHSSVNCFSLEQNIWVIGTFQTSKFDFFRQDLWQSGK
jgi:hypothetical protein